MFASFSPFGEARPLAHIGRLPVTLTLALAALQCLSLAAGVILLRTGLMDALAFDTARFLRGEVWRAFTYGLANDVRLISPLWFLIGLVFFVMFGGMAEARLGAARFGILYAVLWLALPLFLTIGTPLFGHSFLAGSSMIHLGCFIAFAALFPGLPVLFSLTAKWVAAGYAGILALQMAAIEAWGMLWGLFALSVTAVWLAARLDGATSPSGPAIETLIAPVRKLASAGRKPALHVVPPPHDPDRIVDALLDKISKRGISSLTPAERRQLEQARIALIRRDQKK